MNLAESKIATVSVDDKGIVRITLKELFEVTADDVEEYVKLSLKVANGIARPVLFDTRNVSNLTPMAMKKLVDQRFEEITKASALLVNPSMPLTSLAISFLLKLKQEPFPIKVFTDKKEALNWLEGFI